ncbi:uncharacterized protein LOC142530861 [Primulina tabacum]|uniref:uncharacterized protein LOC142530861 n=1 Tax=Primulina tabacum TaxID=48773 RepID=UPI003F5AA1D1
MGFGWRLRWLMGFGWRLRELLLLFFQMVSSFTDVSTSRSLKSRKYEVLVPRNFQHKAWIKDLGKSGGFLKLEGLILRRKNIELADYPETGANNNHDPKPPGRI